MDGLESTATTDIGTDEKFLEAENETENEVPQGPVKEKDEEVVVPQSEEDEEKVEEEKEPEEEEKEEVEELAASPDRPSIAELKAKYPTIFKDFPALRDMYFREQRFSTLFPTLEDAESASENSEAFSTLQNDVLSGNSQSLFKAINETDPKALNKISESLLPTLFKLSPDAHYRATLPLLESVVRGFFGEGSRLGNEDVTNAALHLSNYLFGDIDVAKGTKTLVKAPESTNEERESLDRDRKSFQDEQRGSFTINVQTESYDGLMKIVGDDSKIDPDGVFSKFIKESIREKIISGVNQQMEADKSHIAFMKSLWANAAKNGYRGDWKTRITSAYLARAKSLVPTIRARLISEALGGAVTQNGKKNGVVEKVLNRRESGVSGKPTNGNAIVYDAKKIDWNATSDEDLLNDKVTLKK